MRPKSNDSENWQKRTLCSTYNYIIHMPHIEVEDKLTMAQSLAHSGHFQLVTPSKNLPLTFMASLLNAYGDFFLKKL